MLLVINVIVVKTHFLYSIEGCVLTAIDRA